MSNWKVITAAATTNKLTNPSFETNTTGWSASGTNTIAQSTAQQKFGAYSLLCTYQNNTTLATFASLTLTAAAYEFSAWVYLDSDWDGGAIQLAAVNYTSFNVNTVTTTTTTTGEWVQLTYNFTPDAGDLVGDIIVSCASAPTAGRAIYIDGLQVELQSEATTYCDGDQPGCVWDGTNHASESSRPASTRLGGLIKDLEDDYGFPVERMLGVGATPMRSITTGRALLPGREWQRSIAQSRTFSLVSTLRGSTLANLHSQRQDLIDVLAPDGVGLSDPVVLRYTGAAVTKQIQARYIGGLELAGPDGFAESIALRFQADDPFWEALGESADSMALTTATFTLVGQRKDGLWDNMGPPGQTGATYTQVNAVAISPTTGKVYFGGDFLNFDEQANADYIVEWNPADSSWAPLQDGPLDGEVHDLSFAPDGTLYVVGDFTNAGGDADADGIAQWDGNAFTAVGTPTPSATVRAVLYGFDGNLYVGGEFTDLDGDTDADYLAFWNGTAWADVGGAVGNVVNTIEMDTNNDLYIGGDFTTVAGGGTSANYIAKYDGSSWSALGSGFNGPRVNAISIDRARGIVYAFGNFTNSGGTSMLRAAQWKGQGWNAMGDGFDSVVNTSKMAKTNVLIGGVFTTSGGVSVAPGLAIWNGTSFLPLDIEMTSPTVYAIETWGEENLYIGHDFDGTATYPQATSNVVNNGTARAYPVITIERTGGTSATLNKITNTTTDVDIYLNYSILDGEKITIDLRPGRMNMTSSFPAGEGQGRWEILPTSVLGDFYLLPGTNKLTLYYQSAGSPTITGLARWTDAYWSVD
jgi:hypothetical protein